MRRFVFALSVLAVALYGGVASAGEYHVGNNLLCYDCHTMHFSMQHGWAGGAVGTTPATGGDWLSGTGPNEFLLKAPVNQICLECHEGKTFAPDVLEGNTNAAPSKGREAGALNEIHAAGYEAWKGHTLDSTAIPPGWDSSAAIGNTPVYTPANGLECINCHTQHGRANAYRNLGPRNVAGSTFEITYVIATTNDPTKDVWINQDKTLLGTPGARDAAAFNPYYDTASINFNRIDGTKGTTAYSNKITILCAACHGNFHQDEGTAGQAFKKHPNAGVTIGALGGGHSRLTNYTAATTINRVKVATVDHTGFTNSSPICMSCHKAHGNQNPFGLIFMNRAAGTVTEEGTTTDYVTGHRDLCGQCHGQGN